MEKVDDELMGPEQVAALTAGATQERRVVMTSPPPPPPTPERRVVYRSRENPIRSDDSCQEGSDCWSGGSLSSLCSCAEGRTEKDEEIERALRSLDGELATLLSEILDNTKDVQKITDSNPRKLIPVAGPIFLESLRIEDSDAPGTPVVATPKGEDGLNGEGVFEYDECRMDSATKKYYNSSGEEVIPREKVNQEGDLRLEDLWGNKMDIPAGVSRVFWRRRKWIENEQLRMKELYNLAGQSPTFFALHGSDIFMSNAVSPITVHNKSAVLRFHGDESEDDSLELYISEAEKSSRFYSEMSRSIGATTRSTTRSSHRSTGSHSSMLRSAGKSQESREAVLSPPPELVRELYERRRRATPPIADICSGARFPKRTREDELANRSLRRKVELTRGKRLSFKEEEERRDSTAENLAAAREKLEGQLRGSLARGRSELVKTEVRKLEKMADEIWGILDSKRRTSSTTTTGAAGSGAKGMDTSSRDWNDWIDVAMNSEKRRLASTPAPSSNRRSDSSGSYRGRPASVSAAPAQEQRKLRGKFFSAPRRHPPTTQVRRGNPPTRGRRTSRGRPPRTPREQPGC